MKRTSSAPYKILGFSVVALLVSGCSKVDDIEITMADIVKPNNVTKLTIVRTGSGSGEWDVADKDRFNYYFTSYPTGNFDVELVKEKQNTYCRTTESNQVEDGTIRNEVTRDMLIKEKGKDEITIAIACHKPVYHFFSADSVVSVQMIVEDVDNKIRDTVVFKIVRKAGAKLTSL